MLLLLVLMVTFPLDVVAFCTNIVLFQQEMVLLIFLRGGFFIQNSTIPSRNSTMLAGNSNIPCRNSTIKYLMLTLIVRMVTLSTVMV